MNKTIRWLLTGLIILLAGALLFGSGVIFANSSQVTNGYGPSGMMGVGTMNSEMMDNMMGNMPHGAMMGSGMMAGMNHDEMHSQMMASGMMNGATMAHMTQMGNMDYSAHAGMHSAMMENMSDEMPCDEMMAGVWSENSE